MTEMHQHKTAAGPAGEPGVKDDTEKNKRPATSFDRLVLEDGHRPMIVSLISQHFRDKKSTKGHMEQFDIVKGKGKKIRLVRARIPYPVTWRCSRLTRPQGRV